MAWIAGCGSGPPRITTAVQEREWAESGRPGTQLLTEHFDIRTTVQDALLREYLPAFMETAFAEYARLLPPERPGLAVGGENPPAGGDGEQLSVYLFQTREEWAAFTRRFVPNQAHTYLHIHAGGYMDYRTRTAVAFDLGRNHTLSLLAHEGLHQYAAHYRPEPLPPWLNEGLACQFEAFSLDGPRPTFTPRRNLIRMGALREALVLENGPAPRPGGSAGEAEPGVGREGGLIPLADLVRMDAGEAVRRTGAPVRSYYAQVWSMVLYLRDPSCPYARGFRSLLADAGTPRLREAVAAWRAATPESNALSDAEAAFRHYITPDLDKFMARYRAFAEKLAL